MRDRLLELDGVECQCTLEGCARFNSDVAARVQTLINGIGAFALLIALVGIIIGGAMWGIGSLSSNYHQAAVGKRATLYSVVGAIIVGAAAALVNWAFSLGQTA